MLSKKVALTGLLMTMSVSSFAHANCKASPLHEDMDTLKTEMKSLAFEV